MNVVTQISGNIRPGNIALHALKDMLTHIGINVTHSTLDESLFYKPDKATAWHEYESELAFYESIANSSFHIIYNDGVIDDKIGSQILYAILKGRPVVMTGAPDFDDSINPYMKKLIKQHMPLFHSIKLPELDLIELSNLLRKLEATDYKLSTSQKILIKSHIKSHFRSLLDDARAIHLGEVQSAVHPIGEN
jgi:hypothetical protein